MTLLHRLQLNRKKKRNTIITCIDVYTYMKITWVLWVFAFALLSRKEFYKMVKKSGTDKKEADVNKSETVTIAMLNDSEKVFDVNCIQMRYM